jgi:plastocyanin
LINGDLEKPHGWAVVAAGTSGDEPLRGRTPSASGAAAMLFDHAATSGRPAQTITFSAPQPGHYVYLCQVGDHARMGMRGDFEVATG